MVQDERDFGSVEGEGRGACLEGFVEKDVSAPFSSSLALLLGKEASWVGRQGREESVYSSRRFELTFFPSFFLPASSFTVS